MISRRKIVDRACALYLLEHSVYFVLCRRWRFETAPAIGQRVRSVAKLNRKFQLAADVEFLAFTGCYGSISLYRSFLV